MENEITLDFKNNGGITLDDISFGPPETIQETVPEKEVVAAEIPAPAPALVAQQQEVVIDAPKEGEEKKKEGEVETKIKLEDISFDDKAQEDSDPELEQEDTVEIDDNLKLAAIRAIISKKLERHNLEAEVDISTLTEEQLVEFEEEVDETILEAKYSKIKSVDSKVATILDYIEAGGDPKKITSLFQERDIVDAIDISTPEGQTSLLRSYLKNIKGLSEEAIVSRIDKLSVAGLLEEEATDIKKEYDAHNENKVALELENQRQQAVIKEQNENRKKIVFDKALKDNNVPLKLQDELKKVAFQEGVLPNGEKIKILDYKILKMQSEPDSFYKLSMFLADPEGYDNMVIQNIKNNNVVKEMKKGFNVETKPKAGIEKTQSTERKTKVKFNFN